MKKRVIIVYHKYNPEFYDVYLERAWFQIWKYIFWKTIEGRINLEENEAVGYQLELMKKHSLSALDVVEV